MEGRLIGLDPHSSPFFEIAATGPDEREYNPVARPVGCSPEVLMALRGVPRSEIGGRVVSAAHAKDAKTPRKAGRPVGAFNGEVIGLSAGDKAGLVARYKRGEPMIKLAFSYNVPVQRVREILKQAGVGIRQGAAAKGKKATDEGNTDGRVEDVVLTESGPVEVVEAVSDVVAVGLVEDVPVAAAKEGETMVSGKSKGPARTGRQLSEQDELAIVAFYEVGHSVKDSAAEFGIGMRRAEKILVAHGVTIRPGPRSADWHEKKMGNLVCASGRIEAALEDAAANLEHPSALSVFNAPSVMVSNADPFAQLSRLAGLVRELTGIDGVQVAGSVSITLSVDLPIGR